MKGFIFLLSLCLLSVSISMARSTDSSSKKPLFIAHYMTWFGLPQKSGRWHRWAFQMHGVSPKYYHYPELILPNGNHDLAVVHYPEVGPYDSTDPDLLEYHILLAKLSGIDGFMVNWYGFEDTLGKRQEDQGFKQLLNVAEKMGFKVCINFDDKCAFPPYKPVKNRVQAVGMAKKILKKVLKLYGKKKSYLKIKKKPVLSNFGYHYAETDSLDIESFSVNEWISIRKALDRTPPFFIHDYHWHWKKSIKETGFLSMADSLFCWIGPKNNRLRFLEESKMLLENNEIEMITGIACPGFNNTPCAGWGGVVCETKRRDGDEYRDCFEENFEYNPGFIQLVTWNDFTEGSTIEPTKEYKDKYLRITAEYANKWLDKDYYGKALDLPKKIYFIKKDFELLIQKKVLKKKERIRLTKSLQLPVRYLLKRRFQKAEKHIKKLQKEIVKYKKRIPAEKKITVEAENYLVKQYAGEKGDIKLKIKNPYKKSTDVKIELRFFSISERFFPEHKKIVNIPSQSEKEVLFSYHIPDTVSESEGKILTVVNYNNNKINSKLISFRIVPQRYSVIFAPVYLLKKDNKEKMSLQLYIREREADKASIKLSGPLGWKIEPEEIEHEISTNRINTIPFIIKVNKNAPEKGKITAEVKIGKKRRIFTQEYTLVNDTKPVLFETDVNQDGYKDYVLGNKKVELHCTSILGGRVLSMILRSTRNNQLLLNYPFVIRSSGDSPNSWVEYGGINETFSGDWPGSVWNNEWREDMQTSNDDRVILQMSSKTKDGLQIKRMITVLANSSTISFNYEIKNRTGQTKQAIWNSHPDLTPGRTASSDDIMIVPVYNTEKKKNELKEQTYKPSISKTHYIPGDNWILAYDRGTQEYIAQVFDKNLVDKIGLWEGENFFTMELLFKDIKLEPDEKKQFKVNYIIGQDDKSDAIKKIRKIIKKK